MRGHVLVTLVHVKLRQEDRKFEASLGHRMRPHLKTKPNNPDAYKTPKTGIIFTSQMRKLQVQDRKWFAYNHRAREIAKLTGGQCFQDQHTKPSLSKVSNNQKNHNLMVSSEGTWSLWLYQFPLWQKWQIAPLANSNKKFFLSFLYCIHRYQLTLHNGD